MNTVRVMEDGSAYRVVKPGRINVGEFERHVRWNCLDCKASGNIPLSRIPTTLHGAQEAVADKHRQDSPACPATLDVLSLAGVAA
jgi:hypothetical protein